MSSNPLFFWKTMLVRAGFLPKMVTATPKPTASKLAQHGDSNPGDHPPVHLPQAAPPGCAMPSGRYSEPVGVYRTTAVTSQITGCLHSWQESKRSSPSPSKTNFPDEFSLLFQSFFTSLFNIPQKGLQLNLSIYAIYLKHFIIAFPTCSVHSLKVCPLPSVFS